MIARPLWNSCYLLARFSVYVSTLFGLKKTDTLYESPIDSYWKETGFERPASAFAAAGNSPALRGLKRVYSRSTDSGLGWPPRWPTLRGNLVFFSFLTV